MSTTHATYKTHKEAREAGLHTQEEWLARERLSTGQQRDSMIPRKGEAPIAVKGKAFFSIEQCEEVVTIAQAKRRGLCVLASAKPVRSFHSRYGESPGFRISDCVPATERSETRTQGDQFNKPELRGRGWTDGLIRQFLPKADVTRVNPHHRCGPPICLYDRARVESIEKTPEFQAAKQRADRRSAVAREAAERKREETLDGIEELEITIPRLSEEELIRCSCEHFNSRTKGDLLATPDSDRVFLARICVNYLRHGETEYDQWLDTLWGRVGKNEALDALKYRIFAAIAETYPWLADECERQLEKFRDVQAYREIVQCTNAGWLL